MDDPHNRHHAEIYPPDTPKARIKAEGHLRARHGHLVRVHARCRFVWTVVTRVRSSVAALVLKIGVPDKVNLRSEQCSEQ